MKKVGTYQIWTIFLSLLILFSCEEAELPIPEPPTGLIATVVSDTQIDLSWTDNSTSEDSFNIERKTGSGAYSQIGTVAKDIAVYRDLTVEGNTIYAYRLFASNKDHLTGEYSNEATSSTQVPTLTTIDITAITSFAGKSGGEISDEGGSAIIGKGLVWSTSPNPTVALMTKTEDGMAANSFTSGITGLNWETEHFVRAYATNTSGTAYGNELSFTTETLSITTESMTEITHKAAISGGVIAGEGGSSIIARGIVWSTTTNPTVDLPTKTEDGLAEGSFSSALVDLSPNTTYYVRAYASNNEATSYGLKVSFSTDDGIVDIDGNAYSLVQIGTQIWIGENLKVTQYNNGTAIPEVSDNAAWAELITPGYSWYNNDQSTYGDTYGALYNGYTVFDGNLCPTGWHVPTATEWTTLVDYLGGRAIAGGKLKESGMAHWESPNTGATNESGFTVLPGGYNSKAPTDGTVLIGKEGVWLSSTEDGSNTAYILFMGYDKTVAEVNGGADKKYGYSVRCLSD